MPSKPKSTIRVLQAGPVKLFNPSSLCCCCPIFCGYWETKYARLYTDSTLALFKDQRHSHPTETILLKDVVPYICIGPMTNRMPVEHPDLPYKPIECLVGIGMDPQASKVHWIVFPSKKILGQWFRAILTTLPKPPAQKTDEKTPTNAAPVPVTPTTDGLTPATPQQQQQQYPQQTTVIVDRPVGYGGGYYDGGSSFMSGALMGSMLGYGMGSMYAPHGGWGCWDGWGHYGYCYGPAGGGYIQDNDTYVTNNYYTSNGDGNADFGAGIGGSTDFSNDTGNDIGGDIGGGFDSGDGGGGMDGFGGGFDAGGGFDSGGGGFDAGGGFDGGGGFGGDFGGGGFGGDCGGGGFDGGGGFGGDCGGGFGGDGGGF